MIDAQSFQIDDPDYQVSRLEDEHCELLQKLFDRCADYALIVEGEAVSPTAAQEIFQAVPPGRSPRDKFMYGLLDRQGSIVGLLEGMRHYPDETVWWIGLLLLAPEVRGRGLGRKLVHSFCEYVRSEQGTSIMLGVVEENKSAYHFWQRQGFERVRQTEPRPFGRKVQVVYVMRKAVTDDSLTTQTSTAN
ncbi:MAG: GNAT family N-acetyltransferase [Chloroflexi bacterium]|nr:MAG: GNAT family N-acetyltransferase [Chloroflexota bacterium]